MSSLQLVASVTAAASGNASRIVRDVSVVLGFFRFAPPLVHAECVSADGAGELGFTLEYIILGGSVILAVIDILLMVLDRLTHTFLLVRAAAMEGAAMGGAPITAGVAPKEAGEVPKAEPPAANCDDDTAAAAQRAAEEMDPALTGGAKLVTIGIAFARFGGSTALALIYTKVVDVGTAMLSCVPSAALDGAYGLRSSPTTPCFDAEHAPIFALALVALIFVGLAWPAVWMATLSAEFVCDCDGENTHALAALREGRGDGEGEGERASDDAAACSPLQYAVEIGCIPQCCSPLRPTRVQVLFAQRGARARGLYAFFDTPVEAHYFWLIGTSRL